MNQGILFAIFLIGLSDVCDTVSQLCLKTSINALDLHINTIKKMFRLVMRLIKIWRVWISFIFSTLSLIFWLLVLSKSDLSLAYSLDSMRYIMIALASIIFLKEEINISRWVGIICVVGGIILVAAG